MRFAQHRISPNKHQNSSKCLHQTPVNTRLLSERTYVHYNNGIYMGGMTSYKRNGQGILLLDDGSSIISQYCFDSMTGHNIIFRENCIISTLFLKNSMTEMVVRTGQCIIKIPFYEKELLANGNGVLVDYQSMKIYHLFFQSGRVVRKIVESNRSIIQQVMNQELHAIMDQKHEDAIKVRLKPNNAIKVLKEGRRIVIGFVDNRHHLEGVGFKLKVNEDYDDLIYPLELKCFERGFYLRNRLQNYGERYFSNGNLYIGEFEDDLFNGQGLLLYPQEEKWVWGVFEGERLKKMLSTNLEDTNKPQSIKGCLREVHEYNTKNWINSDISVLDCDHLKQLLAEAFTAKVTDVAIEKEKVQREEQERLVRIQEHFSSQPPGSAINKLLEEQMIKTKCSVEKVVLAEYGSLKAKVLEIEPRNTENQEYWSSVTPTYRVSPHKILTPTHSNWKIQDSKKAQSKLMANPFSRTSPNKSGHSPYKRFHYPTNA